MSVALPLLITRDLVLNEQVVAVAASLGFSVQRVENAEDVRRWWTSASVVLVGGDAAGWVVGLALAQRQSVYVVAGTAETVLRWSVPLSAMGILLPEQSGVLTNVLEEAAKGSVNHGHWLRVIGGSGGVGASTLAAALAQRLSMRKFVTALVELTPHGGGIDLLFGAEDAPGWRWCDLWSAAGYVGGLRGQLPNVSGVDLVSLGRGIAAQSEDSENLREGLPGSEAVGAVLSSLLRSHDQVVLDGGWGERGVTGDGRIILLVGAGVRAVMAARSLIREEGIHDALLVVRVGPGWRLDPRQVSEVLELDCAGIVGAEKRLPMGLEMGDPPGRARGRYARQVDAILAKIVGLSDSVKRAA